ncbi:MAG TPA: kelch repeat-containing protein [Chitinophagales bacterium]|nr:kelch repeat-containing protein [Chitinophagales bacterium]
MKKLSILVLLALCFAFQMNAQAPQAIPYQAVARDNNGNLIANQNISLRFSIHDGTAGGTVEYSETQIVTTNALGLFSVNIGQGTVVSGTFTGINWSSGSKFTQVELDVAGGSAYIDMGTTQMLSVPYALFAGSSTNIPNGISDGNTLRWNGTAWVIDSTLTNKQTNIGIGTTSPASSALLDLSSTTKGFTMPSMTTAQRDAIASPVVGLQIFNTDDQCVNIYDGTYWIETCGLKVAGTGSISEGWTQKTNFGGAARYLAVGFSIGSKGYIGTGSASGTIKSDFWEYDPSTNAWTQKADCGGGVRVSGVGFSIGTKGYLGTGLTSSSSFSSDFWEYDPATNTWTAKANIPTGRQSATGFSLGNKGYIGTGLNGTYLNDFWEYDPSTNTWTQKANAGSAGRYGAVGISIGSKGYIMTGYRSNYGYSRDVWEYDPGSDSWIQKNDFPGQSRSLATGFSIGDKGYLGTGYYNLSDFWEYNPAGNAWTQKTNFPGGGRYYSVGFSIGTKGYLGTGYTNTSQNDFWEYSPGAPGFVYTSLNPQSSISISDGSWTTSGSAIYNSNAGNVGIGVTAPTQKLEVNGTTKTSNFRMTNGASNGYVLQGDASGNASWVNPSSFSSSETDPQVSSSASNSVPKWNGSTLTDGTITDNGNIGIGVTSPSQKLEVSGTTKTTNLIMTNGANSGYLLQSDSMGNASWVNASSLETDPEVSSSSQNSIPRWNGSTLTDGSIYDNGNVGIGISSPGASAILDVSSTTKGFLMPRMTTAQRDAIVSPEVGLQIFNTDNQCVNIYDGTYWIETCGLKVQGTYTVSGTNEWQQKANCGCDGIGRYGAFGFSVGGQGYIGTGIYQYDITYDFHQYDPASDSWTQKDNYQGWRRFYGVGFSIGNYGFAGTGLDYSWNETKEFWRYDVANDSWSQVADFGGTARYAAVAFTIGNKGYVGTGLDGGSLKKDFWEYNPATNTWVQKANFGGVARQYAVGFAIGNKGYIGTGGDNDFWEYDPANDSWTKKSDFGGEVRYAAVGFSIGGKGYIGTGINNNFSSYKNDIWEYNPANDSWVQKADFGGTPRAYAVAFTIGNKGYIGTGLNNTTYYKDIWEYTPEVTGTSYSQNTPLDSTNTINDGQWTQYSNFLYTSNEVNVGIGTASPSSPLSVQASTNSDQISILQNVNTTHGWGFFGNSSDGSLNFNRIGPNAGIKMTILDAGNVGIGTALPGVKLDVVSPNSTAIRALSGVSTSHTSIQIGRSAAEASLGIAANSNDFANGTVAGDVVLRTETSSQKLILNSGTGNATLVVSNGMVGIGMSSPSSPLSVQASTNSDQIRIFQNANTTHGWGFFGNSSDGSLNFNRVGPNAGTRMTILGDGNVGIGTILPVSMLDVNGAMGMKVKAAQVIGTNNPDATAGIWIYSSGSGTVTLPAANTCANRMYMLVNQTTAATISSYKNLSNSNSTTLSANSTLWLVSDGTNWYQFK